MAGTGLFESVSLKAEGPTASGRAYVQGPAEQFLRVYFNEATGTTAFALIGNQQRIWGWIMIIGVDGICIRWKTLPNM